MVDYLGIKLRLQASVEKAGERGNEGENKARTRLSPLVFFFFSRLFAVARLGLSEGLEQARREPILVSNRRFNDEETKYLPST